MLQNDFTNFFGFAVLVLVCSFVDRVFVLLCYRVALRLSCEIFIILITGVIVLVILESPW